MIVDLDEPTGAEARGSREGRLIKGRLGGVNAELQ